MFRTHTARRRVMGATAKLAPLVAAIASTGCHSSTPEAALQAQLHRPALAAVSGALPDVTVSANRNAKATARTADERTAPKNAEPTAQAWYVTTVKDPVRGIYTAAVERQSLNQLAIDVSSDEEPRALLAVILRDGRPSDIVLSLESGEFECAGHDRPNACPLHVSIDGAPPIAVRFAVPHHWVAAHVHLVGGADARRLLATIGKTRHLAIYPTLKGEKPVDLEFTLTGLTAAISKIVRHSVAANQKLAAATPGV